MKIECTPQELKELLKKEQTECKSECSVDITTNAISEKLNNVLSAICGKETPVAGTTDVVESLDNLEFIGKLSKQMAKNLANYDIHEA